MLRTFKESKAQLGEILSSCEFIDAGSMECVTTNLQLSCPLAANHFYMLIGGRWESHPELSPLTTFLSRDQREQLRPRRGQADLLPGEHDGGGGGGGRDRGHSALQAV